MFKSLNYLLNKKQKLRFFTLFFLMLITVFLEMLSISLILPFTKILSSPNYIFTFDFISLNFFEKLSGNEIVLYSISFFFAIYLIKIFSLLFVQIKISSFASIIGIEISNRLYNNYILKDYIKFKNINSSTILRNIITECGNFFAFLYHISQLLVETMVFTGIVLILFSLKPFETLCLSIFLTPISLIIYKINKNKIKKIANHRIISDGLRLKSLNETISSIKELKLYNKFNYFKDIFNYSNRESYEAHNKIRIIQLIPRHLLELVVILFVLLLIVYMFLQDKQIIDILSVIALFAASSVRLLPSISKIIVSIQAINYNYKSVNLILDELKNKLSNENIYNSKSEINFNRIIEIKNLNYSFNKQNNIFEKFNITIKKNSFNVITGESGAGKSTLINIIMGLIKPDKGTIEVDGKNIYENLNSWHEKIAYVPQKINLLDNTLAKNIAFGEKDEEINNKKIKQCLDLVELGNFKDLIETNIVGELGSKLSGGQIQRIGLARSLYKEPELLILDEATNSLDKNIEKQILLTIQKLKGKFTILMISHNLNNLEFCDNHILLR